MFLEFLGLIPSILYFYIFPALAVLILADIRKDPPHSELKMLLIVLAILFLFSILSLHLLLIALFVRFFLWLTKKKRRKDNCVDLLSAAKRGNRANKQRKVIWSVVLIFAMLPVIILVANPWLRAPETTMLRITPIGTHIDEAFEVINERGWGNTRNPGTGRQYLLREDGTKTMNVCIGDFWVFSFSYRFPGQYECVSVRWHFDENGYLIRVGW